MRKIQFFSDEPFFHLLLPVPVEVPQLAGHSHLHHRSLFSAPTQGLLAFHIQNRSQ